MKKLFLILAILASVLMVAAPVMATQDTQPKDPAGYYVHSVNGKIKYFKNGHPGEPSQWTYIGDGPDQCDDCECPDGGCIDAYVTGSANQMTSIYSETANFYMKGNGTVKQGAAVGGGETASANFVGYDCGGAIGGAGALGGSYGNTIHDGKMNMAYGVTGNIAGAGVLAEYGNAEIAGNGNLATVAVSQTNRMYAGASSNGSFEYSANTSNGIVAGGGVTAGISRTNANSGEVTAVSGQVTVAGISSFHGLN